MKKILVLEDEANIRSFVVINLKRAGYDAIEAGEVDVVDAFATDALLSKLGLTMLEDDLNFFPPYYAVNFSDKALVDGDPQLAETLALLDGTLNEETMAAMNAKVDVDGMDAKDVAHDFLVEQGLIEG